MAWEEGGGIKEEATGARLSESGACQLFGKFLSIRQGVTMSTQEDPFTETAIQEVEAGKEAEGGRRQHTRREYGRTKGGRGALEKGRRKE